MSAQAYKLGRREAAVTETRSRVLDAARELLTDPHGVRALTIDEVARRAGVARMTVYYQFGAKRGLLEALFDRLAAQGLVARLRAAFGRPDPVEALLAFVSAFAGFWASDRIVIRRLRALGAIDPEIGVSIRARDERRREGARTILGRLSRSGRWTPADIRDAADLLHALTSFEMFDALAAERSHEETEATLQRLVLRTLEMSVTSEHDLRTSNPN